MADAKVAIELVAQTAKFEADMARATAGVTSSVNKIKTAFAAIGVTLSVGAFAAFVKGAIDAADRLNDLSKATGVAATTLGGIGFAATQAGADLDTTVKAFGKLNLYIAEATNGNADAAANFQKLGLSIKDLNSLTPEQVFIRVAAALEKYADGPNKAALANAIFKKSYQEILPLLGDGAATIAANIAYWQKYSGVTEDVVKASDKFNDTLAKVKLLSGSLGTELAAKLLGPMQGLADAFLEVKEKGDGFAGAAQRIADSLVVIAKAAVIGGGWFADLGDSIGHTGAQLDALAHGEFARMKTLFDLRRQYVAEHQRGVQQILDALDQKVGTGAGGPPKPRPPAPASSKTDTALGLAKAGLEKDLKQQDEALKAAQDQFKNVGTFVEAYYDASLMGMTDYFNARLTIVRAGFDAEARAYDEKIKILQKSALNADPKERINIERQVGEAVAARAHAESAAQSAALLLDFKRIQKAQEFKDSIDEITIALAQMNGEEVKASTLAFDKAHRGDRQKMGNELSSSDADVARRAQQGLDELARMEALNRTQAQLSESAKSFGRTLSEVGIQQQSIDLKAQSGALTTLDAMNQKAAVAKEYIGVLEQEAQRYEAIAAALEAGTPARAEAVLSAHRLRLEIEQLGVAAEATGKMFTDIFTNAFADGLTEIITGTKSIKDAFRDMERSIVQSITRIAARNIAEALLGKSGPGAGVGDLLGKLLSGLLGGPSTPAVPADVLGPGFDPMGLMGFPGFASGTNFAPGGWAKVGERGPELVNLPRGSQVIPNDVLNARRQQKSVTYVTNVNVLPGASRQSAAQASAAMAREMRVNAIRNG